MPYNNVFIKTDSYDYYESYDYKMESTPAPIIPFTTSETEIIGTTGSVEFPAGMFTTKEDLEYPYFAMMTTEASILPELTTSEVRA